MMENPPLPPEKKERKNRSGRMEILKRQLDIIGSEVYIRMS